MNSECREKARARSCGAFRLHFCPNDDNDVGVIYEAVLHRDLGVLWTQLPAPWPVGSWDANGCTEAPLNERSAQRGTPPRARADRQPARGGQRPGGGRFHGGFLLHPARRIFRNLG